MKNSSDSSVDERFDQHVILQLISCKTTYKLINDLFSSNYEHIDMIHIILIFCPSHKVLVMGADFSENTMYQTLLEMCNIRFFRTKIGSQLSL